MKQEEPQIHGKCWRHETGGRYKQEKTEYRACLLYTSSVYKRQVFEIPAILAGILTQISLWSINLRIMGGKSNLPLLKVKTLISGLAASFGMTQAQASMIVGIVLAVAAILFLYWFFGTEIGSAMRATGNNEDMVRALGVDTRMTKLLSLMVSNGLVGLSGALVCQSQKYGDVGSGTGAIVIGLAAIVIGEVLMLSLIHI